MTIEKSPPASSGHKATTRADNQGGKAQANEAEAQGGGGFMAILGALGDAPVVAASDLPSPDATTAQSAAMDAATLLQQNPQIAAAQTPLAAAVSGAAVASSALGGVSDGTALVAKSDAGQLQPTLPTDASDVSNASAKRPGTAATLSTAGDSGAAHAVQVEPKILGESVTQGLQHAAAHAKAGQNSQWVAADTATASSSAPDTSSEKAEAMKWMAALEQTKAPQATKSMEPAFASLLVRTEKSTGERAASAFKNAEPGYSGTALGVSSPDYTQPGAAAPITAPEMQVAEQVSYWVSQNVQNAELKLEGLGQSPVEVSISVQGKEAQITFRTDEAATRGVLEGAGAHLKDLLQREGMVLTGVSVGTSGSGDSTGAERRARQAARQGAIAPLQVATVTVPEAGRRMQTVAGRSVDLFV
jgi:flagellar hook-length control protein FliK